MDRTGLCDYARLLLAHRNLELALELLVKAAHGLGFLGHHAMVSDLENAIDATVRQEKRSADMLEELEEGV